MTKNLEVNNDGLVELFEGQLKTLESLGCPLEILIFLETKRPQVIAIAELETADGHIPFLPVIPRDFMSVYTMMPMVRNQGRKGYTVIIPMHLSNVVNVKSEIPYYLIDVEDGRSLIRNSPAEAEKIIKEQGRSPLITEEAISLCIHTDVLTDHGVDATGSLWKTCDVPGITLNAGIPVLTTSFVFDKNETWGAPSCAKRI